MSFKLNTCFISCLFLLAVIISVGAFDVLEFVFGPRLSDEPHITPKSLETPSAQILVEQYGYPFEHHEVTSGTGHILTLHRIPFTKKRKTNILPKPVALFQHGLLAAADTWLFKGPDKNLPYILADAGYDVWMSNMRGNTYSKKHKFLNPDRDKDYWKFGLQDVAYYDLPVIIDYILLLTKQENLYYLGHSIGSTVGLILCSLRPEYNSKIKLHLALAPLVYATHQMTLPHKILSTSSLPLSYTLLHKNIYGLFPRRSYITKILELVCSNGMPTQSLCLSSIFFLVGPNYALFNTTEIPLTFSYFPSGTSVYLSLHTVQMYMSGIFGSFDYGNGILNLKNYNSTIPPVYNLSKITAPVSLHYGDGDFLVTSSDMDYLETKLPNVVGKFLVPFNNFNHMDFMWGIDAKKLLYDRLIVLMNKYR